MYWVFSWWCLFIFIFFLLPEDHLFLVLFYFKVSKSDIRKPSPHLPALLNTDCNQQHFSKLHSEACKEKASSCQAVVLAITWKAVIIPAQCSKEHLKLK